MTHTATTNRREPTCRFRGDDVGKDATTSELTTVDSRIAATCVNESCNAKKESTSTSTATFRLFEHTIVINADGEQKPDVSSSGNGKSFSTANHGS